MDQEFRLELRLVIVPIESGDDERVLALTQQSTSAVGSIVDVDIKPYAKPPGSCIVRVEANCTGSHQSVVERVVGLVGGSGWDFSGSGEEFEAIWFPQSGAIPPVSVLTTWMQVQTIPMRALPPSRRLRG
ncbi:hypothetical protein [Rhizobacter sp. OV335]|uniref:hypothetical protein n=1 Tax=Rhizobacter sp. OV335 TaxID=1500264 RepID=UPI00116111CC|nr:hypothetical protein [Rhizobacter sp. OV335]